jgi:hypothetical protein
MALKLAFDNLVIEQSYYFVTKTIKQWRRKLIHLICYSC